MTDYSSKSNEWFTISADGSLEFTVEGRSCLTPGFAKAGISINHIRTYDEYIQARMLTPNLATDIMLKLVMDGPMTMERRCLVAIVKGDSALAREITAKLEKRNRLGLKVIRNDDV